MRWHGFSLEWRQNGDARDNTQDTGMSSKADHGGKREYGLVLQQAESAPPALARYVHLLLNYRYGLEILSARKVQQVSGLWAERGSAIRSVFLIHDQEIGRRSAFLSLSRHDQIPLFVLLPPSLVDRHRPRCKGLKNVFLCSWKDILSPGDSSLQQIVAAVFDRQGVGEILADADEVPHRVLQEKIERRLGHLDILPTLPELVLRLIRLLNDPDVRIGDLEELLISDPAVVHRLLQVVKSPVFAGARSSGEWTLKEAIMRLGLKQVGAIAQQILLINCMVKPEDSEFDLRRFWKHSVGCAHIADRLYTEKHVRLAAPVAFEQYWVGALLHDIGKLVLGFFFWDHFEDVVKRMTSPRTPFYWAEKRLGAAVTHEHAGELLMLRIKADQRVTEIVGGHNNVGRGPGPLVCLIHVADNLCKDLGLGYLPQERGVYSKSVLDALQTSEEELEKLMSALGKEMVAEIEDLVARCSPSPGERGAGKGKEIPPRRGRKACSERPKARTVYSVSK